MKKLLLKWFPSFFHVCVHNEIKFEDVKRDRALDIVLVDPEAGNITSSLGIADERATQISKICQIAWIQNSTYTATIADVSKSCNHANELAFALYVLTKRMTEERMIVEVINGKRS